MVVELSYLISEKKPICISHTKKGLSHDKPFSILRHDSYKIQNIIKN